MLLGKLAVIRKLTALTAIRDFLDVADKIGEIFQPKPFPVLETLILICGLGQA